MSVSGYPWIQQERSVEIQKIKIIRGGERMQGGGGTLKGVEMKRRKKE
jgi:hypothetical protein